MKATVYSKFPPRFFNETLRPGLEALGIVVARVVNPDRIEVSDIAGVDLIISMKDLMSGTHRHQIKKFAKKNGKKLVELTRKKASWREVLGLRKEPESVPNVKSVKDEHVEPMLKEFIQLMDREAAEEEVAARLSQWWTGRELKNFQHAVEYIRRMVQTGRAPGFFVEWEKKRKRKENADRAPKTVPVPSAPEAIPVPSPPVSVPTSTEKPPPSIPGPDSKEDDGELRQLMAMYEEENDELRQKNDELQEKLRSSKKDKERAEKEAKSLKAILEREKEGDSLPGVITAVQAVKNLVDAGLMERREALEKIFTLVNRMGEEKKEEKPGGLRVVKPGS
jgi:hypothetical protein